MQLAVQLQLVFALMHVRLDDAAKDFVLEVGLIDAHVSFSIEDADDFMGLIVLA